jgi:hypothetical protein
MNRGSAKYSGTVVVIPTRNRAALAMNAIRSVLDRPGDNVQVMVSDNSTSDQDRADLANFCSLLADPRVRYVTPPQPLSMAAHWEWALVQAMHSYDASHFVYLTDRMMFKSGHLRRITDIARLYPDKIISYNHDRIADYPKPIRVEQYPSTGKLFEIDCLDLSYIYSQALPQVCLPRMLNCIAPREALDAVRLRFGNVFSSIAPDFCFGFRCLELFDNILFYDCSAIFHYGLERSNGASVSRGEMTADHADFTANLPVDNSIRNYATPIPELITAANAVFNEYFILKQETKSPRFFEVNLQKYLAHNADEIREVIDPQLRAEMHAQLVAHGYEGTLNGLPTSGGELGTLRKLISPRAISNKLRLKLKSAAGAHATKPAWLFLARHLGIKPPANQRFEFDNVEEAISFINQYPRALLRTEPCHEALRRARELPAY